MDEVLEDKKEKCIRGLFESTKLHEVCYKSFACNIENYLSHIACSHKKRTSEPCIKKHKIGNYNFGMYTWDDLSGLFGDTFYPYDLEIIHRCYTRETEKIIINFENTEKTGFATIYSQGKISTKDIVLKTWPNEWRVVIPDYLYNVTIHFEKYQLSFVFKTYVANASINGEMTEVCYCNVDVTTTYNELSFEKEKTSILKKFDVQIEYMMLNAFHDLFLKINKPKEIECNVIQDLMDAYKIIKPKYYIPIFYMKQVIETVDSLGNLIPEVRFQTIKKFAKLIYNSIKKSNEIELQKYAKMLSVNKWKDLFGNTVTKSSIQKSETLLFIAKHCVPYEFTDFNHKGWFLIEKTRNGELLQFSNENETNTLPDVWRYTIELHWDTKNYIVYGIAIQSWTNPMNENPFPYPKNNKCSQIVYLNRNEEEYPDKTTLKILLEDNMNILVDKYMGNHWRKNTITEPFLFNWS